ncbi:MAG: DUF4129 domain-containing protein [Candidatus Hydrogenedentes bacterium]|nr:DUF4129 domain-containing protein [Candidatus Hydrogenedentota bacterium]
MAFTCSTSSMNGTSMNSRPTKSDTDRPAPDGPAHGPTDFASLVSGGGPDESLPPPAHDRPPQRPEPPTDFKTLQAGWRPQRRSLQRRSLSDFIVDVLTPFMILIMVTSVLLFLLDVRYVYTEVHDKNLRFVAVCFVLGIVALNRLVARDGKEESCLYIAGLAGAIVMYTLATTTAYEVGSVARGFLDSPYVAVGFNLAIVGFIWWVTNRLTHECCVDENPLAGDVGILTGTARRFRDIMQREPGAGARKPETPIDAVDPTQWKKPEKKAPAPAVSATDRLPKRHPGVSILYFSVPVMFIFAVGVRVVPHGGRWMLLMGYFYVVAYSVAALLLLMLTSLGQLRAYFRARRTHIPAGLGPFWLGLGVVFVLMVVFGAAALPNPGLPPLAHIESHEIDFWTRSSTFRPIQVEATDAEIRAQSRFIRRVGQGVLVCLAAFLAYGALKMLGASAFALARRRDRLPRFLVAFFEWLDRFLQRITRLPKLPRLRPRPRIDRHVALSTKYGNPLREGPQGRAMTPTDQIEYAYVALCALAEDLGAPRRPDQTPYEFMESFPDRLDNLRDEARELTDLFVATAYAARSYDKSVEDRLRKFWMAFERARNRVVR